MRKETWLQQEMAHWLAEGLLSVAQSQLILARYAGHGTNLARTVFSVLGAVVFGLGVILFFAWNWAGMSHLSKLGVIFTGLLTAHVAGLHYRQRGNLALAEGLSALGTLLFGSGIFLVSQIYHIDEHYPNGFLLWAGGALLMAWALPSTIQGVLACVLFAVWISSELFHFHEAFDSAAPLLALALLPLAWQQGSRVLFRVALLTSLYALFAALLHHSDQRVLVDSMLLAFTLVAVSSGIQRSAFPVVADIPRELGYAGYLVLLVMFAFKESERLLRWVTTPNEAHSAYFYFFAVLALVAGLGAIRSLRTARPVARANFAILFLTTVLTLLTGEGWWMTDHGLWVWANVAALAHAILWIIDGSHTQHSRKVTLACVLFAAIAVPRFLDLFESLLLRSLLFLLLGAGLFLVGNFYQRHKTAVAP